MAAVSDSSETSHIPVTRKMEESLGVVEISKPLDGVNVIQTVVDPISWKTDEIHRISQAIKSLRWKPTNSSAENRASSSSACSCGDAECIEVCDIREWLPTAKLDDELWTLVLSLGETYLALGKCYVDDHQFHQALEFVELAWTLVYYVSKSNAQVGSSPDGTSLTSACFLPTYIFLANAWTLVGIIYAHFNMKNVQEKKLPVMKLKMLTGDKQRQSWHEGSLCYLMNCSCLVDRAESGAYASTSGRNAAGKDRNTKGHGRGSTTFSEETGPRSDLFKFLSGLPINGGGGDPEYTLSAALLCFDECKKIFGECPDASSKILSLRLLKNIGFVYNELGANRIDNQEFEKAETALQEALASFRQVSDQASIIVVYCNLGFVKLSLPERILYGGDNSKTQLSNTQILEKVKHGCLESLKHYLAAKKELTAMVDGDKEKESTTDSIRIDVYSKLALVYLKLGMVLAKQDTKAELDVNSFLTNKPLGKKESGKHQVSAKDVIRESISLYESLGELRKKEATDGYQELAMYHRKCCMKFLASETTKLTLSKIQDRVQKYVSLVERNWQKYMDFYTADTYPLEHLSILVERAAFLSSLSNRLRSLEVTLQLRPNEVLVPAFRMLTDAFDILLEARHLSVGKLMDQENEDASSICDKFWKELRLVSKNMCFLALSWNNNASSPSSSSSSQQSSSDHHKNTHVFKDLYRMTLASTEFAQLREMCHLLKSHELKTFFSFSL